MATNEDNRRFSFKDYKTRHIDSFKMSRPEVEAFTLKILEDRLEDEEDAWRVAIQRLGDADYKGDQEAARKAMMHDEVIDALVSKLQSAIVTAKSRCRAADAEARATN